MRIYDTMAGDLVELTLRDPGKVSIYACGPTVYDVPHIGHARTALTYDVMRRFLRWRGLEVTLVSNITDIEDKIIARAAERGISESELTETYTEVYIDQLRQLGIEDPDHRPRATEYVDEMIAIVDELVARGAAYVIEGNGVYFDVSEFPGYGSLAHRNVDDLRQEGLGRIEADEDKADPLDFALWKAAKAGEPTWDSPWGPGRPGWHIECVAMSLELLGEAFDIHGGGTDLAFPHHENERAEAEAAGHPFARHWLHSAMLNVGGEKMAKSVGNFTTLGDALEDFGGRALRLAMLQAHYRSLMELSDDTMAGAVGGVERVDAFFRRLDGAGVEAGGPLDEEVIGRFVTAMETDFGTPDAIGAVFDTISAGNAALDDGDSSRAGHLAATVAELLSVMGIDRASAESDSEIDAKLAQRSAARDAQDFQTADRIRDELQAQGIEIEDTPSGTVWHRAR
jgi:cysteinyl-tRNA synthetase